MSTLLFKSGFESATALSALSDYFTSGAWQNITGTDAVSGFAWPGTVWGGQIRFQMNVGTPITLANIPNYMHNELQTVTGHGGGSTKVLYQELTIRGASGTQDTFMLQPTNESGDLYVSYWMKFQSDLASKMNPPTWRMVFEWKTGGDYRFKVEVVSYTGIPKPNGEIFWASQADNNANGGLPYQAFWTIYDTSIAVPIDTWFKFETFLHRANDSTGRIWAAVDGHVICDQFGDNIGVNSASVDRIMFPNCYTDHPYPAYQWVDDLEIWDGFPTVPGPPADDDPDIVGTHDQSDTFNRANNASVLGTPSDSGAAWEVLFGAFGILDNKAYQPSTLSSVAVRQFTSANVEISVQLYGPGENVGIIGRAADFNNFIVLVFTPSILSIYKKVAGSFTLLGTSITLSVASGAKITLRMTADNRLEGLLEGVSVVSASDAAGSGNTKHGLAGDTTYTGNFNNFVVDDIGEPLPPPVVTGGAGGLGGLG